MCSDFVKPLLLWYNTQGRDLPWRKTKDPYRIWVSEIMLQQTRVEAVKGYYERFLEALPDIQSMLLKDVQAGFDGRSQLITFMCCVLSRSLPFRSDNHKCCVVVTRMIASRQCIFSSLTIRYLSIRPIESLRKRGISLHCCVVILRPERIKQNV